MRKPSSPGPLERRDKLPEVLEAPQLGGQAYHRRADETERGRETMARSMQRDEVRWTGNEVEE